MIEWEVLDERPPPPAPDEEPSRPARARRWAAIAFGLLVLVAAGGWLVRGAALANEERLRADVTETLLQEERAIRFGVVEQARDLADPAAPEAWYLAYQSTFGMGAGKVAPPEVLAVAHDGNIALATLRYGPGGAQGVRAYRLVRNRWRRTPVPADGWGEPVASHSAHFTLWLSPRDRTALSPDELLSFLEGFRAAFEAQWPLTAEGIITIRIEPHDLAPTVVQARPEAGQITANSPLLTPLRLWTARAFGPARLSVRSGRGDSRPA